LETGKEESREVANDWVLTTVGSCYLARSTEYQNGTVLLVIKRDQRPALHNVENE